MATVAGGRGGVDEREPGRPGELAGDAPELGGIAASVPAEIDTRRAERLANPEAAEDEEHDQLAVLSPGEHLDEAVAASPENAADEAERLRTATANLPDEERPLDEPKKLG